VETAIVAKTVDHLPLNRQEKIFQRRGVEISRKIMCGGWRNRQSCSIRRMNRSGTFSM
jgi:transposase